MEQTNVAADMGGPIPKPLVSDNFAYSISSAFAVCCWGILLLAM
jgi:hypothetical protein